MKSNVERYLQLLRRGYSYEKRKGLRSDYRNFEDLLVQLGLARVEKKGGRYYVSLVNPILLDFLLAYGFFNRVPSLEFLKVCIRLLESTLNDLKARVGELPRSPQQA